MGHRRASLFCRLRQGARRGAALPLGALFLTVAVVVVLAAWERHQEAGGEATAMHDRLPVVRGVLGALPAGSLFATADFGIGHDEDRLHRRPIGGRPELSRMETDFVFGPNAGDIGQALLPASEIESPVAVVAGEDCRDASLADERRCYGVLDAGNVSGVDAGTNREGRFAGTGGMPAEIAGNVTVGRTGQPGSMAFGGDIPATAFRADGGFRFGHAGAPDQPFNIPQLLSVGTGLDPADPADLAKMVLAVEGEARADSLDLTVNPDASGKLDAGGKLEASGAVRAATLSIGGDMGANAASFTGAVTTGGCTGCEPPQVPQ